MKNIYLTIAITFLACNLQAQYVTIPDPEFLNALIAEGVDTNEDGYISDSEAMVATNLNLAGYDIADFTGIEAFANLDSLYFQYLNKPKFDISQNIKLKYLDCRGCELENLDVTKNTALEYLYCGTAFGAGNNLTTLNVSENKALKYLYCCYNKLSKLDISNNDGLVFLDIVGMPDLYEICVWDKFSESNLAIDSRDSPNVFFTTDCSDITNIQNTESYTIKLYPNPANKMLNIEIPNSFKNNYTIEISNILGKLVYHKVYQANRNQLLNHIDISTYSKGIYIVRCNYKHHTLTRKVVIN